MYIADKTRYGSMEYKRCGKSGLKLPPLSLGLWHNFGGAADSANMTEILCSAFDNGVTHFDLANNYGPPPGSAEENFGKILKSTLAPYRDEMIVSTKAGYYMWEGPYGDYGSRKYILSSLDQSLKRMGLDYVDIFYHHRPDYDTPLEETACALDQAVRQGKALYVGVSNYDHTRTQEIAKLLRQMKTPFIIHQPVYNMLNRRIEENLCDTLIEEGIGCIVYSPLAQGILTDRYLEGIPAGSRASVNFFLKPEYVKEHLPKVQKLKKIAVARGQSVAQLAISWTLMNKAVTSVLVGASSKKQMLENLGALKNTALSPEEMAAIELALKG